jgi:hypothetical protein
LLITWKLLIAIPCRDFTGDNIAFIYPDYETGLVGQFRDGVMVFGRKARVLSERCDDYGIKEVVIGAIDQFEEPMFYSPPTNTSLGEGPREEKLVSLFVSRFLMFEMQRSHSTYLIEVLKRDISSLNLYLLLSGFEPGIRDHSISSP